MTPVLPPPHWSRPPRRSVWPLLLSGFGGLMVGVVLSVGVVAILIFSEVGMPGASKYEADSAAADASVNDCVRGDDLRAADAEIVPCDELHGIEVYVRRPALDSEGAPYHADDLEILGDAICMAEFEPYVSSSYEDSVLDYETLVPTRRAWNAGEHDVVCALFHMDGADLEGTSEGSGR